MVDDVRAAPVSDISMLSVALRELRNLAGATGAAQPSEESGPG
jgi:hypothetical protein